MPAPSSDPSNHLEIETKFEADPEFAVPDLTAVPGLPADARPGEPTVLNLRALYFDTKRLDLVRSKVTLRRRRGGVDDGWHLKLPAGAGARKEVGIPLGPDDGTTDPADRGASAIPEALTSLVAGLTRGRKLRPVAEFATVRTVIRVLSADGTELVEVADDAVAATRLLPGADGAVRHWREIEVEVLDGTAEQMAAVGRALIEAGARPSASASKLARALGVEGSPENAATGAAQATKGTGLTDGETAPTAAEVITAGLRTYRTQLLHADVALRHADPQAEALHDARAAARRIRSILAVYQPLFLPGTVNGVAARMKKLGALIGTTRDLDVVTERVLAGLERSAGGGHHRSQVADHAATRRRHHLDRLRRRVTAKGHLKALRALDVLIDSPPWTTLAARPAAEVLPPMLTVTWFGLRALAEGALADPATPTKAHNVRKAAKTVRYAAETAAPALGTGIADFASYAEQIQDVLGRHQDAVTTAAEVSAGSAGPWSDLPDELVGQLLDAENQEAAATFDEFAVLWALRPELPA